MPVVSRAMAVDATKVTELDVEPGTLPETMAGLWAAERRLMQGNAAVTPLAGMPRRLRHAGRPVLLCVALLLPGCQALLTETTSTLAGITGASVSPTRIRLLQRSRH